MENSTQDQVNINLDLSQTEGVVCEECKHEVFNHGFMLRRVSAVFSPNGEEGLVPIQVFECASCGHVNTEFIPKELK
jgi:DNA-directed RNA polymerase subunit RPC12/RpoP